MISWSENCSKAVKSGKLANYKQDLQRQYDYIQIEHKALKTQYEQQASQVERVRNERTEI